jgi:hypothetical protein
VGASLYGQQARLLDFTEGLWLMPGPLFSARYLFVREKLTEAFKVSSSVPVSSRLVAFPGSPVHA